LKIEKWLIRFSDSDGESLVIGMYQLLKFW